MVTDQEIIKAFNDAAILLVKRFHEVSAAPPSTPGYGLRDPSLLRPSGPITVVGDQVPANGILENLDVDGTITILRTTRPLTIRNCRAVVGSNDFDAIRIGTFDVPSDGCGNVTVQNCSLDAPRGYGVAVRDGSYDILVEGCDVRCGGGSNWQYAYHAARNVRNVVFEGNRGTYRGGAESVGINMGDYWIDTDATMARNVHARNNLLIGWTVTGIVFSSLLVGSAQGNAIRFTGVPRGMSNHAGAPRAFTWEDGSEDCIASDNRIEDAAALGLVYNNVRPTPGKSNRCLNNTLLRVPQGVLNRQVEPDFVSQL